MTESTPRPRVTVGIPVFNGAATIGRTIESVLEQEYSDFEVLISDNASTDATLQVVASFDDPRIRVMESPKNIGAGANWNKVLRHARGRYVKVLSADDILLPGSLAKQVEALDANPGAVLSTGRRELVDESGRLIGLRGPGRLAGLVSGAVAARDMIRTGTNLIGEPSAALIRRDALDSSGCFDEGSPYCVDMDLWLRLLAVGDVHVLREPLVRYRVARGSWTEDALDRQAADVERLLRAVAAAGRFDVTEAELAAGVRRAHVNAWMRRMLYRVLAIPSAHREKVAYLVAGGWNTLFGYLVFVALWWSLGSVVSHVVVLVIAYAVAMVNAYAVYRVFVFRSKADVLKEIPRFLLVYGVTLVANIFAFPALVSRLTMNPYAAQALFTAVVVMLSYAANRYYTFARREGG